MTDGTQLVGNHPVPGCAVWPDPLERMYLKVSDVGFLIDEFEDLRSQTVPSSCVAPSKDAWSLLC